MNTFIEKPATKQSLAQRKPVYGIGINDSLYIVQPKINGRQVACPYYNKWKGMIERCYYEKSRSKNKRYADCSVSSEWLSFSKFKVWMKTQDWEGKELDKDIIIPNNKIYSPEYCMFVGQEINKLLNDNPLIRGEYPLGVSPYNMSGRYKSRCSIDGKYRMIGSFPTIKEAEIAYLEFKSVLIMTMSIGEEAAKNPILKDGLTNHANIMMERAELIRGELT